MLSFINLQVIIFFLEIEFPKLNLKIEFQELSNSLLKVLGCNTVGPLKHMLPTHKNKLPSEYKPPPEYKPFKMCLKMS